MNSEDFEWTNIEDSVFNIIENLRKNKMKKYYKIWFIPGKRYIRSNTRDMWDKYPGTTLSAHGVKSGDPNYEIHVFELSPLTITKVK